jgi:hypothetical protein
MDRSKPGVMNVGDSRDYVSRILLCRELGGFFLKRLHPALWKIYGVAAHWLLLLLLCFLLNSGDVSVTSWHNLLQIYMFEQTRLWNNVPGERVFSVMVAGWFCEKSGWVGNVEDVKPVLLNKNRISTGNHFEEEDFYPDELWNRRISAGLIHLGPDIIWF